MQVSGHLDSTPGGAVFDKDGKVDPSHKDRRSIYLPLQRGDIPTLLHVFDFADTEMVVGQRSNTNVPAQALALMNSPFVRDAAKQIAADLLKLERNDAARIDRAFMLLLGRPAFKDEADRLAAYIESPLPAEGSAARKNESWTRAVQAIAASTGFRMLD